jgi:hypothetical protein
MKRILLFAGMMCAILMISVNVMAQDVQQLSQDVKKCAQAPTIDGDGSDVIWELVDFIKLVEFMPSGTGAVGEPTADDLSAQFKLLWDDEAIYIFLDVTDDVEQIIDCTEHSNEYQYDNMEVFFYTDITNAELRVDGGAYGDYGWQIRANRGCDDVTTGSSKVTADNCANHVGSETGTGYTIEWAISWETLGLKPDDLNAAVQSIGFELSVGDSDDETLQRETLVHWNDNVKADLAWNNINYFGKINLTHDVVNKVNNVDSQSEVKCYPNPARTTLHFENLENVQRIEVMNLLGQEVMKMDDISNAAIEINVAQLQKGIYTVRFTDKANRTSVRKVSIQ